MMYIHCGQAERERERESGGEWEGHGGRGAGGKGRAGPPKLLQAAGLVLTQASCGGGVGPGAAGRRAVSNTAPPRMRCH